MWTIVLTTYQSQLPCLLSFFRLLVRANLLSREVQDPADDDHGCSGLAATLHLDDRFLSLVHLNASPQ